VVLSPLTAVEGGKDGEVEALRLDGLQLKDEFEFLLSSKNTQKSLR
jgi:uncharacterized protein YdcH (DUF465 family)